MAAKMAAMRWNEMGRYGNGTAGEGLIISALWYGMEGYGTQRCILSTVGFRLQPDHRLQNLSDFVR